MASGYLNRIESAFAEAALDSGWWGRALKIAETGSFGVTIIPLGGVATPEALGGLVGPGRCLRGIVGGAGRRALNRARARASMPFDMRPLT